MLWRKRLKGLIGFVWDSPCLSHHPTPYKKDSNSSVDLPKLSESYTDQSTIWKISFWRRTNWHPQRRGFLFRGKLGFAYCAHLKVCFAIRYLAEYHYMFTKHSLPCSVNKKLRIHVFSVQRLLILFGCYSDACLQKTLPVFKQLFAVHLLWTRGCNYCSKALGSVKTVGEGMFRKKKVK